jgi:hypothetical protein
MRGTAGEGCATAGFEGACVSVGVVVCAEGLLEGCDGRVLAARVTAPWDSTDGLAAGTSQTPATAASSIIVRVNFTKPRISETPRQRRSDSRPDASTEQLEEVGEARPEVAAGGPVFLRGRPSQGGGAAAQSRTQSSHTLLLLCGCGGGRLSSDFEGYAADNEDVEQYRD